MFSIVKLIFLKCFLNKDFIHSDVFQERLNSVLQRVKGITGCVDDVLATGVDFKDHDVNVHRLLETVRMNGIKFNPKKEQFKSIKCEFFGHTP